MGSIEAKPKYYRIGNFRISDFICGKDVQKLTVAFVDSGADETIISQKLADEIGVKTYGRYHSYSASGGLIEGRFAKVRIKDPEIDHEMVVGVSDVVFKSDYSDEEGVNAIIGIDFLQSLNIRLDFSN